LRPDGHVAPFGGFGYREAHPGETLLVHEIDDELQLVEALEVGHFRLVTGFHQHFEARLHEGGSATAKHALLTEEVGHGFLAEVGFENTCTGAADATRPGESLGLGFAGSV